MNFSHYSTLRRPADIIHICVDNAWIDLKQIFERSSARSWGDEIPGGSFVYEDENRIRFELHTIPNPSLFVDFRIVEHCLLGLDAWADRWKEGSIDVPGTDILLLYIETEPWLPFASAKLQYGLNRTHGIATT